MNEKIANNMNVLGFKKLVKFPFKKACKNILNLRSAFYLKKNFHKVPHDGKIKVGFIVQMPELWGKQSSVYRIMCSSAEIEPWFIIIPKFDFENNTISEYGDEKEFFLSECKSQKYIIARDDNDWFDISSMKFDYLFYQRPYDWYLPKQYQSGSTVVYTKNCYIPYATNELVDTTQYPISFFRNIYFGFMEDENAARFNKNRFKLTKQLQHFLNIGYPVFEECLKLKQKCDYKRFLWTPRWTYSPTVGGSHFVEYNQFLTDFEWQDNRFTIRPHPLMWENFLKTKKLNEEQIENIKSKWNEHNILIDENKQIENTFMQTDVLISDNSSIIPMFFLTGKPIILCPWGEKYGDLYQTIMPGMYIANDLTELEKYVVMLCQKNDPLEQVRIEIIEKYFSQNINASEKIVKEIINDYNNV